MNKQSLYESDQSPMLVCSINHFLSLLSTVLISLYTRDMPSFRLIFFLLQLWNNYLTLPLKLENNFCLKFEYHSPTPLYPSHCNNENVFLHERSITTDTSAALLETNSENSTCFYSEDYAVSPHQRSSSTELYTLLTPSDQRDKKGKT